MSSLAKVQVSGVLHCVVQIVRWALKRTQVLSGVPVRATEWQQRVDWALK